VALRGDASEGSLGRSEEASGHPDPAKNRAGDPGARNTTRRARTSRQERAARLRSSAPARDLLLPRKRNATCESRRVQITARRPTVRQRIGGGQRNWHRLVPACSGAKAPLACEDRWLVGCARASYSVAEVGEQRRGSKKRDSRWQRGAWTGTQLSRSPQGVSGGCKGVDNRHRGGQAAEPGKARAGRSRGRCGAKVFARRKASQVVHRHARSRERVGSGLGGPHGSRERASVTGNAGEATGMSEARSARIATGRQRPPRWHFEGNLVRPAEANCTVVETGKLISPAARGAKASRRNGNRRGASTRT